MSKSSLHWQSMGDSECFDPEFLSSKIGGSTSPLLNQLTPTAGAKMMTSFCMKWAIGQKRKNVSLIG